VTTGTSSRKSTGSSVEQARAELAERLRGRWGEIEQAAMTRLHGFEGPTGTADPEYTEGLRAAASAALEFLLAGVEQGEKSPPEVPTAVLVQAGLAARHRVSLDTVMRRCFAGYSLFGDFLMEEAEGGKLLQSAALKWLLRTQAALFDRLVAAVTEEYTRELAATASSREARRAERIERLLAGELIDVGDLAYDLQGHHLGAVLKGGDVRKSVRQVAGGLDCRLLSVRRDEETLWVWLGGREEVDPLELERRLRAALPPRTRVAIGESGEGPAGWRITHLQAKAALPIALRSSESFVRYGDVALLASALQNDLIATSLRELYLAPLEQGRDGGPVLRETLRAYFAAERNVSSAAAALGVNRHTVASRLRTAEERLGYQLNECAAELDLALRLDKLGAAAVSVVRTNDKLG
jgi:PucR C-terminal helix-turn-helix domain/GGDEF-like domain